MWALDGKWRLVAMVEIDRGERHVAIDPWLPVSNIMNDARLEPLPWAARFLRIKIPLVRNVSDLPSAGDTDTGLIEQPRVKRPDKSNGCGSQVVTTPNREIHQHDTRIDVTIDIDADFAFYLGAAGIVDCSDGGFPHIEAPQRQKVANDDAIGIEIESSFDRVGQQVRNEKARISRSAKSLRCWQVAKHSGIDGDDAQADARLVANFLRSASV